MEIQSDQTTEKELMDGILAQQARNPEYILPNVSKRGRKAMTQTAEKFDAFDESRLSRFSPWCPFPSLSPTAFPDILPFPSGYFPPLCP